MKLMRLLLTFIMVSGGLAAQAEDQDRYVMCKNQRVVRTVRISRLKDETCQVIYAKEGKDKVVGSGRMPASCSTIAGNVEKNLSDAGWKCRDISNSATVVETPQE